MMDSLFVDIGTAIWLGILTSISPCPLATNIAAISYVGHKANNTRSVFFAGILYTLGRALAYIAVAILVTRSLQSIPGVSMFLQKYMNLAIGPLLLVVGILLLGIFNISFGGGISSNMHSRIDKMGLWGSGLLGILFALAFCPVSAGLFFGALIPLAVKGNSVLMSSLYGIGTAVPVLAFSLIIAFAANMIGSVFNKLSITEKWIRYTTAIVMIVMGILLILRHNFGINF